MVFLYFLLCLAIIVFIWWLKRIVEARLSPLAKFPGHSLYDPLMGNMPYLMGINVHQRWRNNYAKFGSIYRVYVLNGVPYIAVSDPDTMRHVLSTNSKNYVRGTVPTVDLLRNIIGKTSLLLTDGEAHKKHRSVISPAFKLGTLKKLFPLMVECTQKLNCHWGDLMVKNGGKEIEIDVKSFMSQLTLSIIGLAAFGFDFRCIGDQSVISESIQNMVNSQGMLKHAITQHIATLMPFASRYFLKASERFYQGVQITRKLLEHMINEKMNKFEEWKNSEKSFLEMVIGSAVGNKEIHLTAEEVNDEMMTVLFAGHETSSLALTYTLYFLCKFPEWQSKCRDELKALNIENLSWENVHDLKCLKAVVSESLRLLPPAPIVLRKSINEDYFKGYRLPPNTNVSILFGLMQRLPDYWPDPDEFKPERFMNSEQTNMEAYMPFGDGVHKCIGYQFAMAEIYVALALMLKCFKFELVSPQEDLQFVLTITMAPIKPILVKISAI